MRLIDADALPKLLDAEYKQTLKLIWEGEKHLDTLAEGFAEASHIAKYIATTVDAVPVVLCKDCEHAYKCFGRLMCDHGVCMGSIVREDFFCADGVKREEADD